MKTEIVVLENGQQVREVWGITPTKREQVVNVRRIGHRHSALYKVQLINEVYYAAKTCRKPNGGTLGW